MGLDKTVRPLTQSMLSAYNWCPMKYNYQYVIGLVPVAMHLPYLIGGAVHIGVPFLLKYKDLKHASKSALEFTDKAKKEFEKIHIMSTDQDQDFINQQISVSSIINNYNIFYKYRIQEIKVIFLERILQSRLFLEPISGVFKLTGKIDALIKFNGKMYVYELKSSKSLSYEAMMGYYAQMMTYYILAKERFPNIAGIYIDGIQKPQIKLGQNEQVEDYIKRLDSLYTSEKMFFHDIIVPQSKHLKQFKELIEDTAGRISFSEENNAFMHNRFMCRVYGQCEYLLLCDNGENELTMRKYRKTTSANEELEEEAV